MIYFKLLLNTLTIKRIYNFLLLIFSFLLKLIFPLFPHYGFPFAFSIEPTNLCNLKCTECPSGTKQLTRAKSFIDFKFYKKIIEQIHLKSVYLLLYFQGEPFLHKQFIDLVKYAKLKNLFVSTSTSAQNITKQFAVELIKSSLDKLIISFDGTDEKAYQEYRIGGKLYKVKESINNLIEAKTEMNAKTPVLILQFLVMKTNETQMNEARKFAKEKKIKIQFKTMQFYNLENAKKLLPTKAKYRRYNIINNQLNIKRKLKNHCWRLWSTSVISSDGFLLPCCFDKDAEHSFGNLQETKFDTLWKSKKIKIFRQKVFSRRKDIAICRNCI